MQSRNHIPILTITGSDSTSGSGVQADIKTISALGGYAVSAITSITVQNTLGIQDFFDLPPDVVLGQIEAIINDVQPSVVKIGMVRRADVVDMLAKVLKRYRPAVVIYDPVAVSSKGEVLMSRDVVNVVKRSLLPICTIVTLKRTDAEYLLGEAITTSADMLDGARKLLGMGCGNILLHCGTLLSNAHTDVLVPADGEPTYLSNVFGDTSDYNSHGMSGNLSAAIAAYMANGQDAAGAVDSASMYMRKLVDEHEALHGRGAELFNEFVNELAANYAQHNDVRFYADKLNVSATYLAQVSKRIAGKAPKTIIDEYLISETESMLLSSTMTVQEVAYSVGFSSQAHFSKFFKKMVGCTPSEYRKLAR